MPADAPSGCWLLENLAPIASFVTKNLAPIASFVTSGVLLFAARIAQQHYRREALDNSPDVHIEIRLRRDNDDVSRHLRFSLVPESSRSQWEVTAVHLGRRRRWKRCWTPWWWKHSWEQRTGLRFPASVDTITLPADCPYYFPVTFCIQRMSHYQERATLESWCGRTHTEPAVSTGHRPLPRPSSPARPLMQRVGRMGTFSSERPPDA